ncbi:MAG: hypothetical protein J6Y63_07640 [Bacteroidales bacterium]|nr:hypothetical protein [Bacteroidales bacterium]
MKKFFSLIALVGVIAACTPEQLSTAFKLAGAAGEINVEVVKLNGDALEGSFSITGFESLPGAAISYSGNKAVITFQAAESTPLSLTDLTLTASGENILFPESTKLTVPEILAGQQTKLACKIRVGENMGDWYITMDEEDYDYDYEIGYLVNSHYENVAYTHDAFDQWYVNNSDLLLTGTVEVPYVYGYTAGHDFVRHDYAGFEQFEQDFMSWFGMEPSTIDEWIEAMSEDDLEEGVEEEEFTVSAWSYWNYVCIQEIYYVAARLYAIKVVDQELTDEEVDLASCKYEFFYPMWGQIEIPSPTMPGHAHYEFGHGHGHGGDNAGGGISFNE